MLNYLWGFMILIGIIYAALTGNLTSVTDAALDSAREAVTLCITMVGVMSFWVGLMRIAENSGIISGAAKKLDPFLRFLFPGIPKGHKANEYISTNMIANIFGLGWAATPAGLKAMEELGKLNHHRKTASKDMCTFLIINISSLQLIPVNMIAYRSQYGSANPTRIVGPAIIATLLSTFAGILFAKLMLTLPEKKGGSLK
ncbi:nucleoside recognition domain-containing protein [Roseburia sp. 499]|uniref:nucleoside recognition domain-containing protein n=1 Tax=Roseburia sp. 499 TaxID=1261634 RepID=UPI0009519BE0|nr:nucleoside recognition domain-containing protein [Roseburia sp. 499]WVK69736.1 nucleoside recognition protein [Roseburia sp. 499]